MSKTSLAKRSLIVGAFVGTGGMFVAKLIGLLYSIPLSYILSSSSYMAIYGSSYNIYAYFLTIFQSGIPFAVATLVARYMTQENYKSVLLVKKMSMIILAFTGFVGMMILFLISDWIAPLMIGKNVTIMANALKILSLAVFLVPVLASFRGYYQGLKEMEEYAFSQTFEQIFRVGFLLAGASLVVYLFGMEQKWALYIAVFSTTVATVAAIIQFARFDKKHNVDVILQAKEQGIPVHSTNHIFHEIIQLAIPFFVVAVLGNIDQIFHSILMPLGLNLHGYSKEQEDVIIGAVTFVGSKLVAIPAILGPGFATAIIPHITAALTNKDYRLVRKNVMDCLNIVMYIALPISFCIFAFAGPICNTLFYTSDLATSTMVTQWIAVDSFLSTISPLIMNLMLTLELRRPAMRYLLIGTIIKGFCVPILTMWMGYPGVVISFVIGTLITDIYSLKAISETYQISYRTSGILLVRMGMGLLALWFTNILLTNIGLNGLVGGKAICFVKMACNGVLSLIVYGVVTYLFHVPQSIFHFKSAKKAVKRG